MEAWACKEFIIVRCLERVFGSRVWRPIFSVYQQCLDVPTNDSLGEGVSCCVVSRSWRLMLKVRAKSTIESECRGTSAVFQGLH